MSKMVSVRQITDKRLEKFLVGIRDICRSSSGFKRKIDVQIGHIAWRAAETASDVRNGMSHERIASVILAGRVNEKQCKFQNPVELAIEARFAKFTIVAFNPIRELIMQNVGIRVVVREGSAKHIVVTVYHLKDQDSYVLDLPEVPHVIW
jgi:hypothetical protein